MFNSVSQKDLLMKPCVVFLPSINIPPRETEISLENPDLSHQFTINSVSRSPDSKSGKCGLLLPVYTPTKPPFHHLVVTNLLWPLSALSTPLSNNLFKSQQITFSNTSLRKLQQPEMNSLKFLPHLWNCFYEFPPTPLSFLLIQRRWCHPLQNEPLYPHHEIM